jgi:hypothetical protein
MTKNILTGYGTFITMAVVLALTGIITVQASEVTGTLSSDAIGNPQTGGNIGGNVNGSANTTGNLAGTVSGGSSGSSGGGSGGSSSGGSSGGGASPTTPLGSVLGATTDTQTPGFPNAGVAPTTASSADQSLWSTMLTLLKNLFSL